MNVVSARSGRSGPIRDLYQNGGVYCKTSGASIDASIAEEPRMGLDLSYLRLARWPRCNFN
jgi:hypothetical protein